MLIVALDGTTVGKDDLCPDETVAGQPVGASEDAEPAAERESRDSDRRAAAAGNGTAAYVQAPVDVGELRPSTDNRQVSRHGHAVHEAEIDEETAGRGASREVVATAADGSRDREATRERDGLCHVGCGSASHHCLWSDIVESLYGRLTH
ncbi:hypothetical protein Airi02_035490 [Actinoallomurus iriomotensis]|uniref:Uncharacterized protein n=1 Tax=Actinoallomurus iriomotensis TaxID=478107 RepID=A0A9W6S0D1_9ACTN|nr:hypothetical protein Airi02_035490 [Actinoallomurus iriomotensis]